MHAFDTVGGEAYLVRVAKNHPQVFCMLLARILPLQVSSRDGVPIWIGRQGQGAGAGVLCEILQKNRYKLGAKRAKAEMPGQGRPA